MRRIVQPSRCPTRMRQWNVRDAIPHPRAPDRGLERHLSPESVDREAAEKKDHPRPEKRELRIEPRSAERDLGRRRPAIAASGRRLSGKALCNGGAGRERRLLEFG